MTKTETALNNLILEQGWKEGSATAERLGSFLNRRMAALAMAEVEVEDYSDADFEDIAA